MIHYIVVEYLIFCSFRYKVKKIMHKEIKTNNLCNPVGQHRHNKAKYVGRFTAVLLKTLGHKLHVYN